MVSKILDGGSSSQVKAPPHFFKIILSSDVSDHKLRIPKKFISQYGNNLGNHVFLKVPSGAEWKVELKKSDNDVWMCNGWKEFAKYYSIAFGHLLVFRYDGNCNFHVLIFDMSASEIEYPISATQGEQTNINGVGNSKISDTEAFEIDDSVEALGDIPCATYNTRKEEIHRTDEIEKLDIGTCLQTRKANIDRDISFEILDDSLLPDFSVSDRERANKKSRMEINSSMLDIESKGIKLPNQKKNAKIEIGKYATKLRKEISTGESEVYQFTDFRWHDMVGKVLCSYDKGQTHTFWHQFARDNNLKVGDVCVFELMNKGIEPELNVTIFRK